MRYKLPFGHRVLSFVTNIIPNEVKNKGLNRDYLNSESDLTLLAKYNFFILNLLGKELDYREFKREVTPMELDKYLNNSLGFTRVLNVILKVLVHWLFFVCFKLFCRKNDVDYLVKTWIDVNYKSFLDLEKCSDDSFILVLPFPLGFKRQLKYILNLFTSKCSFSLIGLPYSIFDLLYLINNRTYSSLFKLEYNAQNRFSESVSDWFVYRKLFTMDDVDPLSIVSNSKISKVSKKEINTIVHGIGTYSPFIYSNNMYLYNSPQDNYYKSFNFYESVSISNDHDNNNCFISPRCLEAKNIVFYSGAGGPGQDFNFKFESEVLRVLSEACEVYNVKLYFKPHPNFLGKAEDYINVPVLDDKLLSQSFVSCSLYSTSYYSVGTDKSFLIHVNEIPTYDLFGDKERIVNINRLSDFIYELYG
ncbi:hypothetical protein [Vibrio crassostreae]|uniref:hypothetical protein n=1 Tax=Vibrio crassostreae TaxID=246167 RepID=UPI0002E9EA20|nr:hypothetical protein [Vibrio crassostreae]OED89942.1 hypothetical protein A141_13510 [Vibrio crassostreae ZF-91]